MVDDKARRSARQEPRSGLITHPVTELTEGTERTELMERTELTGLMERTELTGLMELMEGTKLMMRGQIQPQRCGLLSPPMMTQVNTLQSCKEIEHE